MDFLKKHRLRIAIVLVIVLGIGLILLTFGAFRPLPDTTTFKGRYYAFDYPRTYATQEYTSGVVSIGAKNGEILEPNVEVNRYQSDPDQKAPASFDAFMKMQAAALCGADGPIESISCTEVGVTPTTTVKGYAAQMLNLTLVRKNLKTGTTTSSTYGPFYVFNTTPIPNPDVPLRYTGIFVYPALSAFVNHGTTTPLLLQQVVDTLVFPNGTTSPIK